MAIIRQNVNSTSIVDGSITSADIADNSVTAAKIVDANITSDKVATDAITAAKIADNSITTAKIVDANITSDKVATDAITAAKIADSAVTTAHMHSSVPLGTKNIIINGDMRIAQRGTSASITGSGHQYKVIDRFASQSEDGSGYNLSQSTDAPSDFNYSMLVTVTGTDTLDIASDNHCVTQRIEGYNIAHLNWGTANAKTVTLSFWVKSSLTGTFGGALSNAQDATRAYGFTYTINSANTWEYKTITIAGDTTGTWATNNGIGIFLTWSLGANSARQTTANQWDTITSRQATGAIGEDNIIGTSGATWQITGVQLEVGDTATPFEHRPYDMELSRCQRYYQIIPQTILHGISSTGAIIMWNPFVEMRQRPALIYPSTLYMEPYPWAVAGSITNATVLNDHTSGRGGDILVNGTYSSAPSSSSVQILGGGIGCDAEL